MLEGAGQESGGQGGVPGEPDGAGADAGVPGPDQTQLVQGHEDQLREEPPGQAGDHQHARRHHCRRKHQGEGACCKHWAWGNKLSFLD